MDQKAIMLLLETMNQSADAMLSHAQRKYDESCSPKSDDYIIRDCKYATLQYFSGYKQGISLVMQNIRKYFREEDRKDLKTKSAELYGASVKEGLR